MAALPVAFRAPSLVALLALSGCFGSGAGGSDLGVQQAAGIPADVTWDTSGPMSHPLEPGPFRVLPPHVESFVSDFNVDIATAAWLPDVPPETKVPVVIDIGPYFNADASLPLNYIAPLFMGLVPHGIAYAQAHSRGTGASGGCNEFFSMVEQRDIDATVTWFANQPWSNGNVALTGISYDGTTTWVGATFGNPHLKTIVPISGLTSIFDHSIRNGSAWLTAPAIHADYYAYTYQNPARSPADMAAPQCHAEQGVAASTALWSTFTGERTTAPVVRELSDYWEERDFKPRILENYEGSVFLVQGLQDWRVPPHMAFPFMDDLQAKGLDTKMLLGQWWHDMPDNVARAQHVRYDYAETLLRWFQKYLYGAADVDTGPAVDVEDSQGLWRTEADWPPADTAWTTFHLGQGDLAREPSGSGEAVLWAPANAPRAATGRAGQHPPVVEYAAAMGPLEAELRIAGQPQLHATFVPTSPEGSRVYAQLIDVGGDGAESVVGHAVMDLRYHAGGYERHTLTPGTPVVARMEFFPMDAMIPAGHSLLLRVVAGNGFAEERAFAGDSGAIDQWWESGTPTPVRLVWGDGASVLNLPLIGRDVGDGKYPGQP